MTDRPRLTREEVMRLYRENQARSREARPQDDQAPKVPWDYRARVKEAAEKALRARNITRGVIVAAKKDEPIVAIIATRQDTKPWVQQADCQVAYEDGIEPEQLGRIMAEEMEENLERVRRGEVS